MIGHLTWPRCYWPQRMPFWQQSRQHHCELQFIGGAVRSTSHMSCVCANLKVSSGSQAITPRPRHFLKPHSTV